MKLRSIALAGFKSFAGKLDLQFEGKRIGIVGPNGCGKSNLLDAMRWVMGESRASQLRQETSADFLFNGSGNHRKADWCSVEIILSNDGSSDLGMWGDYAEISVKRQMERDGENWFTINGQRVRRRDVVDLFSGTGAGARSYNVVEQEQITRIVRSEPQRIRAHLEEAAGVSIYKQRRQETERKIVMSNDNIARQDDRINEVKQKISLLGRQSRQAVRARNLRSQADAAHRLALLLRIESLRELCEASKRRVADVVREKANIGGSLKKEDERTNGLREMRRKSEAKHSAAQSEHYAALSGLERWQSLKRETHEARERDEKTSAEAGETISRTEKTAAGLRENAAGLAVEAGAMENLAELESRRQSLAVAKLRSAAERADGAQARLRQAESAVAATAAAEHAAHNAKEVNKLRLADLKKTRLEATRELEMLPAESTPADDQLGKLRDSATAAAADARASEAKIARQHNDIAVLREELVRQQAQLGGLMAERDLLLKVSCGDGQETENWEKRRGLDAASRLIEISGLSAPGFERAVDAGLHRLAAGKMMNLDSLIDDDGDELPEGRTYFHMRAKSMAGDPDVSPPTEGMEPLAAKITANSEFSSRIRTWLRGKYIAPDMAAAIGSRGALRPGEEMFTPDGVCVGGDYVHGPPRLDTGLEWEASMRGNEVKMEKMRDEIGRTKRHMESLVGAIAAEEENCTTLQRAHHKAGQALAAAEREDERLRHETEFLRERRRGLAAVIDRAKQNAASRSTELAQTREELSAAVAEREKNEEELRMARASGASATTALEDLRANVAEHRNAELSAQKSSAHCNQRIADLEQRVAEQEQLGRDAKDKQREAGERLRAGAEERLGEQLDAATATEEKARKALAAARGTADKAAEAEVATEQKAAQLRAMLVEVSDRQRDEEVQLSARDAELDSFAQRLDEIGSADDRLDRLREAYPTPEEAAEHARGIEAKLDKIGPVNYAADEELTACEQSLAEQQEQRDDLTTALSSLHEAISRIDKEMLERLKEVFARLNEKFSELFRFLFDGGKASVVLTGETLLDGNLELLANPPGKRVTAIQSLSGGEKSLTALAFLFALNEMNPPPFCLLDEVDAMLDDDNTRRFCKLLDTMRDRIQFLLVTHNKKVIETADTLVGVTQEEKGVSKLVTVEIAQVVAAAAAAGAT